MKFSLSPRFTLIIIATLFLLPLALAWMMFQGIIEFSPGSTRNLGQLVQPPIPINWKNDEAEILSGHWVILHATPDPCPASCIEAVTGLRQVHRAAGRNQSRIRVALLLSSSRPELSTILSEIYPPFHIMSEADGEIWSILEQIAESTPSPSRAAGGSYLIDPLGHIMMFYETGSDPNHLRKDLKRLLTWSKLDEQS